MITIKHIRSESIRQAMRACMLASFRAHWGLPDTLRDRLQMVASALGAQGHTIIVAYDQCGGELELVGAISYYTMAHEDNVLLIRISALGSFQAGVGSKLIREVENAAKRLGAGISLMPMDGSEGFYRKLGYVEMLDGDMQKLDYVK